MSCVQKSFISSVPGLKVLERLPIGLLTETAAKEDEAGPRASEAFVSCR